MTDEEQAVIDAAAKNGEGEGEPEPKTPEEVEAEAAAEAAKAEPVETEEEAEGEFVVTIGEESPPQEDDKKAPEWVKDLRKAQSVLTKENRELKERLAGHERKPEITLGAKPVVSDFEYNYETEKPAEEQYAEALDGWYIKKGQVDKQAEEAQAVEAGNKEAWQAELNAYEVEKTALKLKAPNIEEAEALVKDSLSVVYQGGIIDGADKPALMNLYLGTHPEKLKELSSIKSPAKFLVAVGRLESQLKTGTRKAATNPEKKVVGSGSGASTTDATLDKLEKEAEKTGDRTKILNYKRKQNQN
jgi:hypothetical protein